MHVVGDPISSHPIPSRSERGSVPARWCLARPGCPPGSIQTGWQTSRLAGWPVYPRSRLTTLPFAGWWLLACQPASLPGLLGRRARRRRWICVRANKCMPNMVTWWTTSIFEARWLGLVSPWQLGGSSVGPWSLGSLSYLACRQSLPHKVVPFGPSFFVFQPLFSCLPSCRPSICKLRCKSVD